MRRISRTTIESFKNDILWLGKPSNFPPLKEDEAIRHGHILNIYTKNYSKEEIALMYIARQELIENGFFYTKDDSETSSIFCTKLGEITISKLG
jgi:hypothetical protein